MKEVKRKAFSMIGGVLLASLSMHVYVLLATSWGSLLTYFFHLALMGIASIGAFVGGFFSRDMKVGFLTGLLAGMLGVPIITQYSMCIYPRSLFSIILTVMYTYNLGRYVIFGLVAGAVGSVGAWVRELGRV